MTNCIYVLGACGFLAKATSRSQCVFQMESLRARSCIYATILSNKTYAQRANLLLYHHTTTHAFSSSPSLYIARNRFLVNGMHRQIGQTNYA